MELLLESQKALYYFHHPVVLPKTCKHILWINVWNWWSYPLIRRQCLYTASSSSSSSPKLSDKEWCSCRVGLCAKVVSAKCDTDKQSDTTVSAKGIRTFSLDECNTSAHGKQWFSWCICSDALTEKITFFLQSIERLFLASYRSVLKVVFIVLVRFPKRPKGPETYFQFHFNTLTIRVSGIWFAWVSWVCSPSSIIFLLYRKKYFKF